MTRSALPADDLPTRVAAAARAIRERSPLEPRVGVTLGSGLGEVAARLEDAIRIPTSEIPHWPRSTVPGHHGRLALGRWRGVPVAVLMGRTHRYEGYSLDRVTFGARILHALGARTLVFTNAVGAVNPGLAPGDLMLATDHVNWIGKRGLFTQEELAKRRAGRQVARVYDPALGEALAAAALRARVVLRRGVLLGGHGPSYETAAEVRMAALAGVDAVCMSTVHEATVAAHLGCRVASVSCVTNRATGLSDHPLAHHEVTEVAQRVTPRLRSVLEGLLESGAVGS